MAGRIREEDINAVRERARIDEVVRETVTLKSAGGGSYKGLCPFHDERTPSFHVTPSKNLYHCFSCGEGGDVITFVRKVDALSFTEAVEKLAAKYAITLRYDESGSGSSDGSTKGLRTRLIEAHNLAAKFYQDQLITPAAQHGRTFLTERGFDEAACAHFGVGYSPAGWDGLSSFLKSKGFTEQELITGGLAVSGQRGAYDRFRDRLMWPIRDAGGDVIGFGARKLSDADQGPKYLNTPETPIYKKSQVLYGLDLARRDMAKTHQAVIVEGYTDVMACHLSGITTAVATCGTAFGSDHVKIIRRIVADDETNKAEVIFTFDGDAAGRKAAMKAFTEDQSFVASTFVAVEPHGLDPCDLRMQQGEQGVQQLIASRTPLFEFVIRSTISDFDLNTAEGRVAAMRAVAPILAGIKDAVLRPEYIRMVAGWIGIDDATIRAEVSKGTSRTSATPPSSAPSAPIDRGVAAVERTALKCILQVPQLVSRWYSSFEPNVFTVPAAIAVFEACERAGDPNEVKSTADWVQAVMDAAADEDVKAQIRALAVEPLPVEQPGERYVQAVLAKVLELTAGRQVNELKAQLQRSEIENSPEQQAKILEDLMALENYRRDMRAYSIGDQ